MTFVPTMQLRWIEIKGSHDISPPPGAVFHLGMNPKFWQLQQLWEESHSARPGDVSYFYDAGECQRAEAPVAGYRCGDGAITQARTILARLRLGGVG